MTTLLIRAFFILYLLSTTFVNAQYSYWTWAESFGDSKSDVLKTIDSDDDGNICFAGYFDSDTLEIGEFILQNMAMHDGFIVKCNETGEVIWATNIGGSNDDIINDICIDNEGNVYIAGQFKSNDFKVGEISIPNNGGWDCFFAKFNPSGNVLWAKGFGGSEVDIFHTIGVDSYGNIWISGSFENSSIRLDDITLLNPYWGYDEIMLVKANTDGNIVFGTTACGNNDDRCYRLAIDKDDNVIISGGFGSSSIDFSSITIYKYISYDIFLAKYDNSGNIIWAKGAHGPGSDYGFSVTTDSQGNIYTTGYYSGTILNFDDHTISNNGDFDTYIAKYTSGGDVIWAKGIGGVHEEKGTEICILNDTTLYFSGQFESPLLELDTLTLFNNGDFDCFIIELDEEGNIISAENFGGEYSDKSQALSTCNGNCIIHGGIFSSSSINIGDHTITNSNQSFSDSFIAKYLINATVPVANFDYEAFSVTVNFYNISQIASSFTWDFGDGIGSELKNPVHTYDESGEYVVTLIALNEFDSDTISKMIYVCELPVASFEFEVDEYQMTFINSSLNGLSYFWNFGDGNYAYLENPVHTYSEEGDYNVTLIAFNECGSDTSYQLIDILNINELTQNLLVTLYPNPSKDILYLSFNNENPRNISLEIFDSRGHETLSYKINNRSQNGIEKLDISSFRKGLYYMVVRIGDQFTVAKIIKI